MYKRVLIRMREKIRKREFHARREMIDDNFTIYDIERGILTGAILERQKDKLTGEWKYRIKGKIISGDEIELIVKLSPTNKLVIITVYEP